MILAILYLYFYFSSLLGVFSAVRNVGRLQKTSQDSGGDPGQSSPLWRDRRCDPWICSACWELSNCQGNQWMTRDLSDAGRSWQALSYSEGYGVFNSRTFKDVGLQPSARLFSTMSVHWKHYFETLLQILCQEVCCPKTTKADYWKSFTI